MPISNADRFKIICFIAGVDKFAQFKAAYWKQQDLAETARTGERTLSRAFNRWEKGAALHTKNEEFFLGALKAAPWPSGIPQPEDLFQADASVPEFLDRCKLKYEEVERVLSTSARKEWGDGHHRLHFMQALDNQSRHPRAKALLPNLLGTYRLYRRHSMLPGILKEHFAIDKIKDGHCEGTYIQFARAHPPNIIPFNAYFCEFSVIAFGAHQAVGRRTEIVTVSVIIENAFSGETLIPCDENNKYFIGLLTGIYDSGNVLLAERVLIEKIDPVSLFEDKATDDRERKPKIGRWLPIHIHQGSDRELRGEYNRIVDVIDNSLDGQTLTARADRIELVRD